MKDLGKTKYCLGLQIEHCSDGVLIHQSTCIEKVLKRFHMDKSHPLSSPMVVRSFEVTKDLFRPKEENEVLEYHISVQLVHECILQIILDQTLFLS